MNVIYTIVFSYVRSIAKSLRPTMEKDDIYVLYIMPNSSLLKLEKGQFRYRY